MSEYLDNLLASAYGTVSYTEAEYYESFLRMFRMPLESLLEVVNNPKAFEVHIAFVEGLYGMEPDTLMNKDLRSILLMMRDDEYCHAKCLDALEEWKIYRCQFLVQCFTSVCNADPVLEQFAELPIEQFHHVLLSQAENDTFRESVSENYFKIIPKFCDAFKNPKEVSFRRMIGRMGSILYDCSFFHNALKSVDIIDAFFFDFCLNHIQYAENPAA